MSKTVGGTTTQQTWDVAEDLPLPVQDGSTKEIYGPNDLLIEQVSSSGSVNYIGHNELARTGCCLAGRWDPQRYRRNSEMTPGSLNESSDCTTASATLGNFRTSPYAMYRLRHRVQRLELVKARQPIEQEPAGARQRARSHVVFRV